MGMILKQLSFSRLVDADFSSEQETVCRESTDVILKVSIILVNRRSRLGRSEAHHSSSGRIIDSATETAERQRQPEERVRTNFSLFSIFVEYIYLFERTPPSISQEGGQDRGMGGRLRKGLTLVILKI
jgi:hypothetical protein